MKLRHSMLRRLHGASFRRLGSGLALGMTGVYLTLVCLAATCGFMPSHTGTVHAHHGTLPVAETTHLGHHEEAADSAPSEQTPAVPHSLASSLCAWACQASASSLLPVEPLGSPVVVAQFASPVPDDLTVSAPVRHSLFARGPPRA